MWAYLEEFIRQNKEIVELNKYFVSAFTEDTKKLPETR